MSKRSRGARRLQRKWKGFERFDGHLVLPGEYVITASAPFSPELAELLSTPEGQHLVGLAFQTELTAALERAVMGQLGLPYEIGRWTPTYVSIEGRP